jgi:hypothetical protein
MAGVAGALWACAGATITLDKNAKITAKRRMVVFAGVSMGWKDDDITKSRLWETRIFAQSAQ